MTWAKRRDQRSCAWPGEEEFFCSCTGVGNLRFEGVFIFMLFKHLLGFPGGSAGKESVCNAGDRRFDP